MPAPLLARFTGCLAVAVALIAPAQPARAWHDDGHRIIGAIAEANLSPATRAEVRKLLADLPDYSTLATASTWADQRARQQPELAFLASSHYVNVDGPTSGRELYRQCLAKAGCVALGVAYYSEIVRSEHAAASDRAEALRLLAHFVGDVHQPLHAGRADDRGGNDIDDLGLLEYTPVPERTNLHAAWDGGAISLRMTRQGWDWSRYAEELAAAIDSDMRERWPRGSVFDWIEESRRFARANAYLHADGRTPIRSGEELSEAWYRHNLPVVEQRLQQAGLRLALVLEELLG